MRTWYNTDADNRKRLRVQMYKAKARICKIVKMFGVFFWALYTTKSIPSFVGEWIVFGIVMRFCALGDFKLRNHSPESCECRSFSFIVEIRKTCAQCKLRIPSDSPSRNQTKTRSMDWGGQWNGKGGWNSWGGNTWGNQWGFLDANWGCAAGWTLSINSLNRHPHGHPLLVVTSFLCLSIYSIMTYYDCRYMVNLYTVFVVCNVHIILYCLDWSRLDIVQQRRDKALH